MNWLFPVAFLDPPQVLSASITSIPAASSSPLQVVADLGFKAAYAIDFTDTTGDFIGVYTGAAGHEVLRCTIGGGVVSRAWVVLAAHSRVSLRSLTSSAVTNGQLNMVFMGMGYS